MKYKDIIDLPRPISDRPRMTLHERAAQFSPFAALTGYENAIQKTQLLFDMNNEPDKDPGEGI